MNKKILLFLLLLPFFIITVKAQSYDSIHIEKSFKYLEDSCKNFISFACNANGMPSENTFKYMDLIISERYDLIEKLLYSDNPSNQFLSVIILEFLEKKRKITINDIVKKQISGIKQSEEIISVCRGCTYHNQLSLKELLTTKNIIRSDAVIFCKRTLKIKKRYNSGKQTVNSNSHS